MFGSFSRSWELVKTSFSIIRQDKELLIFPIMSMIALALVSVTFFIPMALAGLFDGVGNRGEGANPLLYVIAFVYYVIVYFIMIFSNAALVGATMKRLQGGDPTFSEAWNIAMSRADKIFGWAIISATVGMILQAIENAARERAGFIGQIIVGMIGFAWSVATFLVVPVLVVENLGPLEAIKRSSSLLKRTWGEQLVGNFGIGLIFILLFLVGAVPLGLLTVAAASISIVLAILVGAVLAAYVLFIIALGTAVSGIFTAAVYAYATRTPIESNIFEPGLIENAFVTKPATRRGMF